jgi:hypothetical protein
MRIRETSKFFVISVVFVLSLLLLSAVGFVALMVVLRMH